MSTSPLASRVSGSLIDAKNLTSKLGTALEVVSLVAAILIASLLTLSSVAKRIRELGTLKALGWSQRLVVRQVTGESVLQGMLGGVLGILLGLGGAALVTAFAPTLKATVATAASQGPALLGPFGQGGVTSGSTSVSLTAPVSIGLIALAVALALVGGVVSGAVGGLRAARLRPAELRGVSRVYEQGANEVRAVDSVDLRIEPGEFVVVAGPSGSGKTTLLQLLGALDRPTAGVILFEGRDLAQLRDAELTELRLRTIGFIFQQFNLIPNLTALENVEAGMAPIRMKSRSRRDAARQLLDEVGLGSRTRHLPSQLSGGEQQRVAIARALAKNPRVLLADEPTGNLDSRIGAEILELIALFSERRGQTVVLVTHDREASRYARRTIRLRDGRLLDRARVAPDFSPALAL